ncbi:MAG: hypothetical protein IPJ40_20625 [Saprospirales bacterium]|nr:hypothetical protein [Saprospirales bacterium]
MRKLHLIWLLAGLFVFSISANATTYTLNGGNWSSNSNWSGNTPPPNPLTAGNSIIVAGNSQLDITNYVISSGANPDDQQHGFFDFCELVERFSVYQ